MQLVRASEPTGIVTPSEKPAFNRIREDIRIPGAFYAFITITYIMQNPIGFGLDWTVAYIIGITCAVVYLVGTAIYGKNRAARKLTLG